MRRLYRRWPGTTMATLAACAILSPLALVTVTACGGSDPAAPVERANSHHIYEAHPRLADGRQVTCLVYAYDGAGMSCDWTQRPERSTR